MKSFPFVGNDEYIYDQTTNFIHDCKHLSDECNISHLSPTNSYLVPNLKDNPELTVMTRSHIMPIRCQHCFEK